MAVAFDAVGPSSAGTSSLANTALSWSHTCTGTNLCLLVGVGLGVNPDGGLSMTATYNSVAMTSLGVVHSGGSNGGFVQMWRLVGPATGANTVAITASGGTPISLEGGSVSYTGVNQTTPCGTPATASSQTGAPSVTVTGTTSGNMVAATAVNGSDLTASSNTGRWLKNADPSSAAGNAGGADAAAGGSVTLSWTATADWWSAIGVELLAASSATTAPAFPAASPPGRISPAGRVNPFPGSPGPVPQISSNVSADLASGTGAAGAATPSVSPTAGNAAGTGTANQATVTAAPSAGNAAGTGAANTASLTVAAAAGAGSGAAAANSAVPSISATAGNAAGIGSANSAVPNVGVAATNAAGTGAARQPGITATSNAAAEAAAGSGTAQTAAAGVSPPAGAGSGTGAAGAAVPNVGVAAGNAAGTGAANQAATQTTTTAGNAAGVGAANQATVNVTGSTNASAEAASGVGAANPPVVGVATSTGVATATGAATAATPAVRPTAGVATGVGAALLPTVFVPGATNAPAGVAAATGAATGAALTTGPNVGRAAGVGAAWAAGVTAAAFANAVRASGVGAAYGTSNGAPVIAYPIRPGPVTDLSGPDWYHAGVVIDLAGSDHAGLITTLAGRDHAGAVADSSARIRAGLIADLATYDTGADVELLIDLGNSGTSRALPVVDYRAILVTLTADCTFTFTGTPNGRYIYRADLILTQDYLGNHRITWPTTVQWAAGQSTELSAFPGAVDKVRVTTYNAGTTWFAEIVERDYGRVGRPLVGWSMPDGPKTIPGIENEILGRWQARNTWLEVAGALYLDGTELVPYTAANPGRACDLGIALIPHDLPNTQWNTELDAVIAGTHDTDHYNQGQALAAVGPATVYARPWWEFNSENPAVHLDKTKFIAAWQRAVTNVRRGFAHAARPGQRLHIVYSPLPDRADQYVDNYPGDEYVDVISYDVYGKVWSQTNPTVEQMIAQVTAWLTDLAAFGRARSKPVAVSEWANLAVGPVNGEFANRGCGDCVEYIDLMFDWAEDPANNCLYTIYFDSAGGGVETDLDSLPLSKARLVARAQAIQTVPAYPLPDVPTIGAATPGAGAGTVAFTPAPTGVTASSYTATSTPGGFTATGSSSPLTVSGLAAGTPYTFTVHATNQAGDTAESAASNSVTPFTSAPGFDQPWDRLLYSAVAPPATFTITLWAYLTVDRGTWSTIVQLRDAGNATVAELASPSGTSGPGYWDGSTTLSGTTGFTVGQWRKLAITRTGSTGKLYSATPAGTTEVVTGTVNTATPASITIGAQGPNDSAAFWNGRIACVRVWNSVLTQSEIEAEWPSKTPVKTSGLFANWRLASGTDLTDTVAARTLTTVPGFGLTFEQGPPVT